MASFFVTGASGFVGKHLVKELLGRGHRVGCLSRRKLPPTLTTAHSLTWLQGDLLDPRVYEGVLEDADYVVHLAGLLSARRRLDYVCTNVHGTEAVLDAAARSAPGPRRFVYVSTIAAMGPRDDGGLLRETDSCRPRSEYGRSKLEAERVIRAFADRVPAVILRPSFIYGPSDARCAGYLRSLLAPRELAWRTNVRSVSFCHVSDVVESCLLAVTKPARPGDTFLISEAAVHDWDGIRRILVTALDTLVAEGAITDRDMAASLLDRARRLDPMPPDLPAYEDWGCDTGKARRLLGFESLRTLETAATDTIRHYASTGLLREPSDRAAPLMIGASHDQLV